MGFLAEVGANLDAESKRTMAGVYQAAGKAFSSIPDIAEAAAPVGADGLFLLSEPQNFQQGFAHFRNWVYTIVNHIATRLAGQPINVGEVVDEEGDLSSSRSVRQKAAIVPTGVRAATRLLATEDLSVINEGPLVEALERPNAIQSRYDFVYVTAANLLMTGEAYIVGGLTRNNDLPELWAVPTKWIHPRHEGRLFSSYVLRTHPNKPGIPLDPESVARIYLPDPTDPRSAISPIFTQLRSVHIDEHIQASQEKAFENGIFPTLALRVGRIGGKDKAPRKLLQAHQRRQLISAVRKIYGGVARSGEPMILDALIEGVDQITRAPREMDWNVSAESVKKRLFQAFGLNPVAVGEITGVNRAQAYVAEAHQCENVLNPLLDKLSCMVNSFIVPMFFDAEERRARVVAWFEQCKAYDDEQEAKEWHEFAKLGFVTQNEVRHHRLGLDPVEEGDKTALAANPQAIAGVTNLLRAVGEGVIPESSAALLLSKFFGFLPEESLAMVRGAASPTAEQVRTGLARIKAAGKPTRAALIEHRQQIADAAEKEVAEFLGTFLPGRLQLEHRSDEAA